MKIYSVKRLSKLALGATIAVVAYYVWYVHFDYRFETISENKVYKSALIPPEKLEGYLKENNIRTVINLLHPGVQDELNPAAQREIDLEAAAIEQYNEKYNTEVNHVNIASHQVPSKKNMNQFLALLDDESSYPVLIHCFHGTGRAEIYSALYRIEFENWSNEQARQKTRLLVSGLGYESSFADSKEKGQYLLNYTPRNQLAKQQGKANNIRKTQLRKVSLTSSSVK